MKQDEAKVESDHQLVMYVEREDGTYGPMQTGSYMKAHYWEDYVDHCARVERASFDKVCKGLMSPIGYYIAVLNMTEADLGARVGIRASKVRKHLDPKHFGTIQLDLLRRYAEIFSVPVANLLQFVRTTEGAPGIVQRRTENPYVVVAETEVESNS